mmetsp:Transcript_7006/g.7717  ORF Transcript_7006/g.7717 Transcript_7006/m.7717 type:complete len:118 (-) Transcript_7006:314-667(-)|eukprot:CAMPEP_0170802940 /NCGR_PEP_ID=MMETSP0733-20121128/29664_1 /TAXON_ID=186038 /ORGANISM="Fragilariopsis kerguelensis, Strain L26-C5" /LENGTH=117 /DNA_ID=CAMNT_0011156407 /DNA_START=22 /DNA_END=375 /DNA_ORIENTATION=-
MSNLLNIALIPEITMTTDDTSKPVATNATVAAADVAAVAVESKKAAAEEGGDKKINLNNLSPEFLAEQERMMANIKSGHADDNVVRGRSGRDGGGGTRTRMTRRRSTSLPIRKATFA